MSDDTIFKDKHIGIDCRMWDESGIGRYVRNLVFNLAKLDRKNNYYLFLLKKNLGQNLPENFKEVEVDFKWYSVAEQVKFPLLLIKYRLNLMHFPHFNVPIFYMGKYVVTIHDLIHKHHDTSRSTTLNPITHKIKKVGYNFAFKDALKNSKKILTPSESVKKQLVNGWNIKNEKIIVTPEGVDQNIIKLSKEVGKLEFQHVTEKFKINPPYLFYVGNAHPHKNIEKLISVFQQIKITHPELKLVLSGRENYFWKRVIKESNMTDAIYTGFVTDQEMISFYKNALCFIFPSLEEGFGLPILEAFAGNCPVVCSNIPVFQEVAGEAAFYFDSKNDEDMRDKILQVIENARLRAILKQKGLKRLNKFSWQTLAKQTLEVYTSM